MAADYSICLGTAGWGVWHSPDGGVSWTRQGFDRDSRPARSICGRQALRQVSRNQVNT